MAERLTTRFHGILVKEADVSKIQVITKLGQLEDIMEKYHCNDIGELEKKLADSDTWQKACELACEDISTVKIITNENMAESDDLPNYFYQQAKKEGEQK